jgi:hypothetical protein
MKNQFVVDVVHFNIQHRQTYIHDHATHVEEVVEVYCQVHGFNDDDY